MKEINELEKYRNKLKKMVLLNIIDKQKENELLEDYILNNWEVTDASMDYNK